MTARQSTGEADKLVRRYLTQLDAALQSVEATRRQEILAEVHEHIDEERTELDPDDTASVRSLLSRVGDPAAIAAEAGALPPGSGRWDAWAPWLIIFGPIASGLGWIAGMLILWPSPTWSRRDKLIATDRAARRPDRSVLRPRGRTRRESCLPGPRPARDG